MSIYITNGDDDPRQIASNNGYGTFIDEVTLIPEIPELKNLINVGHSFNPEQLKIDVTDAIENMQSADSKSILQSIFEYIDEHSDSDLFAIIN